MKKPLYLTDRAAYQRQIAAKKRAKGFVGYSVQAPREIIDEVKKLVLRFKLEHPEKYL